MLSDSHMHYKMSKRHGSGLRLLPGPVLLLLMSPYVLLHVQKNEVSESSELLQICPSEMSCQCLLTQLVVCVGSGGGVAGRPSQSAGRGTACNVGQAA